MLRKWLYSTIINDSVMQGLIQDRIYQNTGLREIPTTKPFIIYRVGPGFTEISGDDLVTVTQQAIQVFFHDTIGDYDRIDQMIARVKRILVDPEPPLISSTWVEDGPDLLDDEFHTNVRYSRFQINYKDTLNG